MVTRSAAAPADSLHFQRNQETRLRAPSSLYASDLSSLRKTSAVTASFRSATALSRMATEPRSQSSTSSTHDGRSSRSASSRSSGVGGLLLEDEPMGHIVTHRCDSCLSQLSGLSKIDRQAAWAWRRDRPQAGPADP